MLRRRLPAQYARCMPVRVDAWVWAVRLAKTRSQATAAVKAGHVRVNDAPAKPSQQVSEGDVVRVRLHGFEKIYRVTALATRRGSAASSPGVVETIGISASSGWLRFDLTSICPRPKAQALPAASNSAATTAVRNVPIT